MNRIAETKDRRMTVIVVILTAFATSFTGSSLNLSIPAIAADYLVSASLVGWLATIYALSVAAFSVPFGRVADITSRKKILMTGLGIFLGCCILSAFSPSFSVLLALRFVQGIGASMIFSTNTAVIIAAYPPEMRGKAIGYSLASTYVGLSSGPVIGGIMNSQLGWRSIFIFTGSLCILAFILAALRLPGDQAAAVGRPLDLKGNILYILFIIPFMYGLSMLSRPGIAAAALTAAGIAAGVFFVLHEYRQEDPAVNVRLFVSNIGFGLSNLSALFNYSVSMAMSYLVSLYLQSALGFPSHKAGLIMVSQPLMMALFTTLMGKLSDRVSPFSLSSAGMAVTGLGISTFIFVGADTDVRLIIAALIVTGFGFSMFSSPNTNAIMSCVEKKDYGVASSLVSTMRTIGQTVGMVIVTLIVTARLGDLPLADASPEELIGVIHVSFIFFVILCAIGVVISLQRKRS